jgi:tetratricopeptide (TPR) repeat protein
MARFDKLEFRREQADTPDPQGPAAPERDNAHWLRLADAHRRQGLYENALRFYSRALELDKSLVAAWVGQVQVLILLEEYPQAETWSRTGLNLFPAHADLLAGRAQAYCRLFDMNQAQALCDGALKQNAKSSYGWFVRGELMIAARQKTDDHCFDNAQQLDPDWLVALEAALVYLHYRIPSKALRRSRHAVEQAPDHAYAWYVQALCQARVGFDEQAQQSYQRCLELSPGHEEAKRRLCELQQRGWSPWRWLRRMLPRS